MLAPVTQTHKYSVWYVLGTAPVQILRWHPSNIT